MSTVRSVAVTLLSFSLVMPLFGFGPTSNGRSRPVGPVDTVTAARPGLRTVGTLVTRAASSHAVPSSSTVSPDLSGGEGSGPGWCAAYSGYQLGASFHDVYACGPPTGTADPFDTVGFQCVELSARFLWVGYGRYASNVPDGRDFVAVAHSELGIPVAVPRFHSLPAPGDIVSLWGDANSLPYGHTAVVTGVSVNSSGNGKIDVMEENGAASGSDYITVSDWNEFYGDPGYDGGYYYYDHVEWLELVHPVRVTPTSDVAFSVSPLGTVLRPSSINDVGMITGIAHYRVHNISVQHLFIYGPRVPARLLPSPTLAPNGAAGISNYDSLGVSIKLKGRPLAYSVLPSTRSTWTPLAPGVSRPTADAVMGVDAEGDLAGWASVTADHRPSVAVVWLHRGATYPAVVLRANTVCDHPRAYATDYEGDAVGMELLRGRTLPAIWIKGAARVLPTARGASPYGVARALSMAPMTGGRKLTVVGSVKVKGRSRAAVWHVRIGARGFVLKPAHLLAGLGSFRWSDAVSVNLGGWIVGVAATRHGLPRAFVYEPGHGSYPLTRLVPKTEHWVVTNALQINNHEQIAAQGYVVLARHRTVHEGLILNPVLVKAKLSNG
ncbi:MAG TPA: CHAP domain-containing protein [Chloroflexota bacterium]|nr:CHAP domain-containing protein [Chloroflexota bacterium]